MSERALLLLAQTLCTRLCHDLAGSAGAVTSGADLLREESEAGRPDPQLITLLSDSAASIATRLRFLRAVMGVPTGRGLDPEEAQPLLADYLTLIGGTRSPTLDWSVTLDDKTQARTRPFIQVVLNLCLVAIETLPRLTHMTVQTSCGQTATILVRGDGTPRPDPLTALQAGLSGQPVSEDPRAAQGLYTGLLASALFLSVSIETDPGVVRFNIRPAGGSSSALY